MPETFEGSRLKIERAEYHISDIDDRINELIHSGPHGVSIHTDPNTGYDVIQANVIDVVPEDFALVIGDALHNLKAALDFAVNEVVFRRLKRYDAHARFPVRETREKLIAAVNGGLVKQASEVDVTGEICTKWNERESTWRKSGSCQSRGTNQSRS